MKKTLLFTLIIVLLFSSSVLSMEQIEPITVRGKVLEVLSQGPPQQAVGDVSYEVQVLRVKILSGKYQGEEFIIENALSGNEAYDIKVSKGDRVLIDIEESEDEIYEMYITNFLRDRYLYFLIASFIALLLIIGGLKGFKAVITLSITAFTVIKILLPMILAGYNPIWVAILSAVIITIGTFLIIGGINMKSASAIIGTIGGVLFAGILAYVAGSVMKLTGLSSQEAMMLMYIPQGISFDFRGLLFAGIIIGTLGAVMDIGMSIASAMYEMKSIQPEITPKELIRSGLNIGKDVMGTMSNTLILAYAGSSLPLLLLFMAYEASFIRILNLDLIATEVVRSLVGSIGLILAIPLTALAAGFLLKQNKTS